MYAQPFRIRDNIEYGSNIQYCAIETGRENEISFSHLFHTNSPDGNFCETVSPHFPPRGRNWFPPNFPWISPEFPRFPNYSYWFPLISQFTVQFSIQLHKCTLSLSIRPILCILHVSLKMRIPHYTRQRIINLGNFGENQGILWKSDEKLFIFFHSFSQVWNTFPSWGNRIPPISPVATVKTPVKKVKGNSPWNVNSLSFPLPARPVSIAQYCKWTALTNNIHESSWIVSEPFRKNIHC